MREKLIEIMNEHGLYGDDPEEVIKAVYELICYKADKMKKEYPYAVVEIQDLERAAYKIFELLNEVDV